MRPVLVAIVWLCTLGTVVQLPLLGYELWLLASATTFAELTVSALLTEHLTFLSWIADIITAVLGDKFGAMILDWPVTLVTVFKLIFGLMAGYWALNKLQKIDAARVAGKVTGASR